MNASPARCAKTDTHVNHSCLLSFSTKPSMSFSLRTATERITNTCTAHEPFRARNLARNLGQKLTTVKSLKWFRNQAHTLIEIDCMLNILHNRPNQSNPFSRVPYFILRNSSYTVSRPLNMPEHDLRYLHAVSFKNNSFNVQTTVNQLFKQREQIVLHWNKAISP